MRYKKISWLADQLFMSYRSFKQNMNIMTKDNITFIIHLRTLQPNSQTLASITSSPRKQCGSPTATHPKSQACSTTTRTHYTPPRWKETSRYGTSHKRAISTINNYHSNLSPFIILTIRQSKYFSSICKLWSRPR